MRIAHNMMAMNTQRQLGVNGANSKKSIEKLSSGLRINRAGDDAAGLAISEKMRAQIRGLNQASRNAQDGISLVQTAEGALQETQSILQRMRELSVQASNDTNTTDDREQIQKEIDQLTSEINRIGKTTQFNEKTLLNGDFDFKAAESAKLTGTNKLTGGLTVSNATSNTSASVTTDAAVTLPGTTGGSATAFTSSGSVTGLTDTTAIDATKNELTIDVGGTTKTYTLDTSADLKGAIDDLNAKMTADSLDATASLEDGKLVIKSTATGASAPEIDVKGGNFAAEFMGDVSTTKGTDNGTFSVGQEVKSSVEGAKLPENVNITGGNNELTINVNGTDKTITLADKLYEGDAGKAQLAADINTALTAKGVSEVSASYDAASGKLKFESASADDNFEIRGGNMMTAAFGDEVDSLKGQDLDLGTTSIDTSTATTLSISVNGAAGEEITLTSKTYDGTTGKEVSDLVDDINTKINANANLKGHVKAELVDDGSGNLSVSLVATNSTDTVELKDATTTSDDAKDEIFGTSPTATTGTDISAPPATVTGQAANNELKLDVDGTTKTVALADGEYADLQEVVDRNKDAFDAQGLEASVDSGKLVLTSKATGSSSSVGNIQNTKLAQDLGLVDSSGGSTATAKAGDVANTPDTTLDLKIGGEAVQVDFATGSYTKDEIVTKIQDAIDAKNIDAKVSLTDDDKLQITTGDTGKAATVEVVGANDGLAVNLGLADGTNALKAEGVDAVGGEVKFQIGSNKDQSMSLSISDMRASALGITGSGDGYTSESTVTDGTSSSLTEKALDVSSHKNASNAIDKIDDAIKSVSTERSKLGATQNRLEHTINNLQATSENLQAAESRIRDTDMAKEMMEFQKNNILQQAAQAMLAQANQQSQGVLQLLR